MALEDLRSKINDLKFLMENENFSTGDPFNAKDIADNIKVLCEEILPSSSHFAYFLSSLFSTTVESSLFIVLKQLLKHPEFDDSICNCIDAFTTIVLKTEITYLDPYVSEIIQVCLRVVKQDSLKAKREAGYTLLISTLELSSGKIDDERLKLDEIIKFCHSQLETLKKSENTGVKKGLYQLMGLLCKLFPEKLVQPKRNYGLSFAAVLAAEIKAQMASTSKSPQYGILEACFHGFNGVLCNFSDVFDAGRLSLRQLYDYCKMAVDPENQLSRHGPQRAALALLTDHAVLFRDQFLLEFKVLYKSFQFWAMHSDRDLRLLGFKSTETLFRQIADLLPDQIRKNLADGQRVYSFFVEKFRDSLQNSVGVREIALAVKGLGYFAEATKSLYHADGMLKMIRDITSRSENIFLNSPEPLEQKVTYVPYFLEASAYTMAHSDEIPIDVWPPLETLHVLLYQHFPLLDKKYFFSAISSSYRMFISANLRDVNYSDRIINQSLIRLFSLLPASLVQTNTEADLDSTRNPKNLFYKDYLPLWTVLVTGNGLKILDQDIVREIADQNFDALIRICLEIIQRLDLKSQKISFEEEDASDEFNPSSQPLLNLQPKKRNDFCIFINLVDFLRDLLTSLKSKRFEKWISNFIHFCIEMATKYPLVSGFYKLLTLALSLGNDLNYFHESNQNQEKNQLIGLLNRFIDEVLIRMKQFKDDLLVSCLLLILKMPLTIVKSSISSLSGAVKTSLKLGLTYLPLAENCMDALELWNDKLSVEQLKPLYQQVLSSLDEYLKSEQIGEQNDSYNNNQTVETTGSKRKRKRGVDKKKIIHQKPSPFKSSADAVFESKLTNIRHRILIFVGLLGGELNHGLIDQDQKQLAELCTNWDTDNHIQYSVPFVDMKPTIVLDQFLPRLCSLATSSGDRQTKIAACESLHSIVLYMLGKSSQQNQNQRERSPMHKLYRRLFPVLLELCCDADELPKELFRLLLDQIIHWFASSISYENPETVSLLDSLLEGTEISSDAAVRDYSARCVDEFLKWSVKHSTAKDKSPMENNVRSLFKRIYRFAAHPSAQKRLAASLIFNAVYRTFREENELVNKFSIELLTVFLNSLALANHDDESEGTIDQCVQVIDHLERIFMKRSEVFLKPDKNRRVPTGWSDATLKQLVQYLFDQIGRPAVMFRQKCFELFEKLTPFVGGPKQFFSVICNTYGHFELIRRFEGGANSSCEGGIISTTTINLQYDVDLQDILLYLERILASIDCYFASLNASLMEVEVLFSKENLKKLKLFDSIRFYLGSIFGQNLKDTVINFAVFTPKDLKKFNHSKCMVFVRLLQFYTVFMNKSPDTFLKNLPENIFPQQLFEDSLICCFDASKLGFDLSMKDTVVHLPTVLRQWISAVARRSPSGIKEIFINTLKDLINREFKFVSLKDLLSKNETDWFFADNVLKGYSLLNSCQMLPGTVRPDPSELWKCFVDQCTIGANDFSYLREWTPSALNFVKSYLKFVSELGLKSSDVIAAITDDTPVKFNISAIDKNLLMSLGMTILDQFCYSIALFATSDVVNFSSEMIKIGDHKNFGLILTKILDTVGKDVELRKKYGEKFAKVLQEKCADIFCGWVIARNDAQAKSMWITVVQKIAIIESKIFTIAGPISDKYFDSFLQILTDKGTNLNFKCKALTLLGLFGVPHHERDLKLKSALNTLVVNEFPLKSTEFTKDTQECDEFLTAIRRLLFGLTISENTVIFEILVNLLCRENDHIAEEEITNFLKIYCQSVSVGNWHSVISAPFDVFWRENADYSDDHRLNCLEKLLLPMLNGSDSSFLKQFFLTHLNGLIQKLDSPLSQYSDAVYKSQLISKMGCWRLLELMYNKLDLTVLKGEINEKFLGKISQEKTELIKKLFKLMPECRKEGKYDTNLISLKWRYRCSVHNCMISILMATQTKSQIFDGYIFKDAWDCIAEPSKTYFFDIDVTTMPKRQKQILSIGRSNSDPQGGIQGRSSTTLQFLSSQFLADSSLGTELPNYDFTNSLISGGSSQTLTETNKFSQKTEHQKLESFQSSQESDDEYSLEIETDELNSHPSMELTVTVIKFLVDKKITPINPEDPGEMPIWMKYSLKQLESSDMNTKLFIARVITLLEDIFSHYAKYFLMPLIKLLLDPECGPSGLHMFRIDVLVTMLGWSKNAVPERSELSKHICSELLEYIMLHAASANSAVLRRNIQILNLTLQLWSGCFIVEPHIILQFLSPSDKNETKIAVGIQILGVVLRNRLNPLGTCIDETKKQQLYGNLANRLDHKSSKIYKSAAEVIGLSMKYLLEQGEVPSGYDDRVQSILLKIQQQGSVGKSKFLECLQAIQIHYPNFSDKFLKDVLLILPNVHGDYKSFCLEIICGRAEFVPNLFDDLKTRGLNSLLVIRDEGRQLWTLNILYKIIDKISIDDIKDIIASLVAFVDHPHAECRFAVAEIFFRLYDLWNENESDRARFVIDSCRESLLKLLNDNEPLVRQTVYNFWSHETRLSSDTVKRLTKILSVTYSANTERQFLAHATYLLLELTSKSPDFKKELFDKPLTECKFEDFKVVTNWRRRYASLQTPAFADSQTHLISGGTQTSGPNEVRATLAHPAFTQTQFGGSIKTYDWMTGGSYDTYADTSMMTDGPEDGDLNQLMFRPKKDKFKHIRAAVPTDFGKKRLTSGSNEPNSNSNQDEIKIELKRLKRRILKDRVQSGYFFARMETRRKQIREKLETERKTARDQNVSLYRGYRFGDFPDIQIAHSALLTPLQAVAQRDSVVAGRLFESLMSSIYAHLINNESESELINLNKKFIDGIDFIMKSTAIYYGPLMSSLMIFCYNNCKTIKIDVEELKISSINSNQQKLGAILMENYILTDCSDLDRRPPPKKIRRAIDQPSDDDHGNSLWIELSKLYKSLGDFDTVRTIFRHHLNTKESTKKALELESKNRFSDAIKIYTDALMDHHSMDKSFNDLEIAQADCWQESRLQCLNDLGDWKELADVAERSIDDSSPADLSKIWDDQYLQDFYFPFLLRAKLKLIMIDDQQNQSIISFVDESLIDTEKRLFFQERYPLALAVIDFMKQDYQKTRYDCDNTIRKFLRDWSSLSFLDFGAKKHLLQDIHQLAEMLHFLNFKDKKSCKIDSFLNLIDFWLNHSPNFISDEIYFWDDVLQLRSLYIEKMCTNLVDDGIFANKTEIYKKTVSREIAMKLQYVRSATDQRNFPVAFSQLTKTKKMLNFAQNDQTPLAIEYCRQYAETQFKFLDDLKFSKENFDRLITVLDICEKFRTVSIQEGKNRQLLLKARTVEKIGWMLYKSESISNDLLSELCNQLKKSGIDLDLKIFKKGPAGVLFGSAYELYREISTLELSGDQLQPFVDFCDNVLRQCEDGLNATCPTDQIDAQDYAYSMVDSLLKSMKAGSAGARRMFPRLMQILETFSLTSNHFVQLTDTIPCWMFLKWLNQIVGLLDKSIGSNLFNIVEKISDEYPNALVYPLLLSQENYRFGQKTQNNRLFVERIALKMKEIPLVKTFIDNLILLSQPDQQITDRLSDLNENLFKTKSKIEQKKILKQFYNDVLMKNRDENSLGVFWKNYIKKYSGKFDEEYGENFEKFVDGSSSEQNALMGKLFKLAKDEIAKLTLPKNLKEYSLWLAQFSSDKQGAFLEIPGQYTGDSKPSPANHVFIYGFDSQVKVFSSLRRPKSITILGNDGLEYQYLVKSGEDLRQDHRVIQILEQMNAILCRDAECSKRSANILTYSVIPLTTKVGLIELMQNVDTLKDFIFKYLDSNERKLLAKEIIQENCFGNKFYGGLPLKTNAQDLCYTSYEKYPHDKAAECLRKAENCIPKNLLRESIFSLCSSPESFFEIRRNFTVSYATMCTAHYLLGVGDRHLTNLLIDTKSATMIGIDFGYVFGTSIQLLPVPELMPFRLTKQIRDVFEPIGPRGTFETVMVHCMRAFRENSKLLLNTMDIFAKEPALNWMVMQEAKRQFSLSNKESGETLDDLSWYPKQKLEIVARKFNGDNPVVVIEEELRRSRSYISKFPMEKVLEVVYGCSNKVLDKDKLHPRGYSKRNLSIEDQVRCLIEIATDPVVLVRVFYGWEPWV